MAALAQPSPAPALPAILGLTADSRQVRPGFLFAAFGGAKTDGRRFVREAVRRGAAAILTDPSFPEAERAGLGVTLIIDDNPRRRLALMAAAFHQPQPRTIVAVTGTNGKTSVAAFTRQIWQAEGRPAASLGTLGIEGGDRDGASVDEAGTLTTPDPVALHASLARLARRGIDHVAVEASSHGLDQYRLDGLQLAAACFTNLTRDHLDYHGTMAAYLDAKARLFEAVLPPGGTAVVNLADPAGPELAGRARAAGRRVLTYGTADADLALLGRESEGTGQIVTLGLYGRRIAVRLPLVGAFQAANALGALGLALATGSGIDAAVAALTRLKGARGRLERVGATADGAAVYVDYAHTPDALETVLTALRPHVAGKLVVVFGAGGDRDPGKRPLMGEVAARLADHAIVTDDNPRGEDPAAIRAAIRAAAPEAEEIGDRAAAIAAAVARLGPGDSLVIAGKGHESGQTVAGVVTPFDDAEMARSLLAIESPPPPRPSPALREREMVPQQDSLSRRAGEGWGGGGLP